MSTVTSEAAAREIMGPHFYGLDAVARHLRVRIPSAARSEVIPFRPETLRACAETHVLFMDTGPSVGELRDRHRSVFEECLDSRESCMRERSTPRWRLMLRSHVPESTDHTFEDQQMFVPPGHDVPPVREVVYAAVLTFRATEGRLFEHVSVRTSSAPRYHAGYTVVGRVVSAGWWGNRVILSSYGSGNELDTLGVAATRTAP